jgi:thiamine-monophosphate kinase
MRGEFDLIARYFAPLAAGHAGSFGLTDDAAVIDPPAGCRLVTTLDTIVAGVHYLPDDPPDTVARKLLRVNLSDLAAMGAAPYGYLLSLALSKAAEESWVAGFAEGLAADQAHYGLGLLGGDTTSTPGPTTLSLTALGTLPAGADPLRRQGARAGQAVYVSGTIGDAALGLQLLLGELTAADDSDRAALAERYRLPHPRLALGQALQGRGLACAALDVSDGLVADLAHLCAASGVAAEVDAAAVPLSGAAQRLVEGDRALLETALTGGDDYELVFAAPDAAAGDLAQVARTLDLPLTRIGRLVEGAGVRVLDAEGAEIAVAQPGWTHF